VSDELLHVEIGVATAASLLTDHQHHVALIDELEGLDPRFAPRFCQRAEHFPHPLVPVEDDARVVERVRRKADLDGGVEIVQERLDVAGPVPGLVTPTVP
jgi:hypothetical protein